MSEGGIIDCARYQTGNTKGDEDWWLDLCRAELGIPAPFFPALKDAVYAHECGGLHAQAAVIHPMKDVDSILRCWRDLRQADQERESEAQYNTQASLHIGVADMWACLPPFREPTTGQPPISASNWWLPEYRAELCAHTSASKRVGDEPDD